VKSRCLWGAAVIIVGLSACSHASKDFGTVTGKVVDSRSGKPVAGVSVRAGAIKAVTATSGVYTLHAVPKTSALSFAKADYVDASSSAAPEVASVRLRPIPITGHVRSTLTSRGLKAQLSLATAKATADANGNFTMYGVGPGDHVQVAADGYTTTGFDVPNHRVLSVVLYPTVSTERAYDLPGIEALWRDFTASWGTGGRAGSTANWAFVLAHDYPHMGANCVKAAAIFPVNTPRGYAESYTLDVGSVRRFNNWLVSFGGDVNDIPLGRTYVMNLTTSFTDGTPSRTNEVHVALYNGQPRMFVDCSADGQSRIGPG
jgi:hypothetical protein